MPNQLCLILIPSGFSVASGDWGTPSEYVRELIRQDKERRLGNLEPELVAAAPGRKINSP